MYVTIIGFSVYISEHELNFFINSVYIQCIQMITKHEIFHIFITKTLYSILQSVLMCEQKRVFETRFSCLGMRQLFCHCRFTHFFCLILCWEPLVPFLSASLNKFTFYDFHHTYASKSDLFLYSTRFHLSTEVSLLFIWTRILFDDLFPNKNYFKWIMFNIHFRSSYR